MTDWGLGRGYRKQRGACTGPAACPLRGAVPPSRLKRGEERLGPWASTGEAWGWGLWRESPGEAWGRLCLPQVPSQTGRVLSGRPFLSTAASGSRQAYSWSCTGEPRARAATPQHDFLPSIAFPCVSASSPPRTRAASLLLRTPFRHMFGSVALISHFVDFSPGFKRFTHLELILALRAEGGREWLAGHHPAEKRGAAQVQGFRCRSRAPGTAASAEGTAVLAQL